VFFSVCVKSSTPPSVDKRKGILLDGEILSRPKLNYDEVTPRNRRLRKEKFVEAVETLRSAMKASPMKIAPKISFTASQQLAMTMDMSEKTVDILHKNAPSHFPSPKNRRKERDAIPNIHFNIVRREGALLKKYSYDEMKSLRGDLKTGEFAIVHSNPVGYIKEHLNYAIAHAEKENDKYLSRKIVFGGDEGQSVFSFGFWIAANGQSRKFFLPLFYYYPVRKADQSRNILNREAAEREAARRAQSVPLPPVAASPTDPSTTPKGEEEDELSFTFDMYGVFKLYGEDMLKEINDFIIATRAENAERKFDDPLRTDFFLSGDWKFMNEFLGLMGPTSVYGCFICKRKHQCRKGEAQAFSPGYFGDMRDIHTHNADLQGVETAFFPEFNRGWKPKHAGDNLTQEELLLCYARKKQSKHYGVLRAPLIPALYQKDHLVPLPLHVFLGLGQSITTALVTELKKMSADSLQAYYDFLYRRKYKQVPSSTTLAMKPSAANTFNGEELRRMINDREIIADPAEEGKTIEIWPIWEEINKLQAQDRNDLSIVHKKANITTRLKALSEMTEYLSSRKKFTPERVRQFNTLVKKYAHKWINLRTKKSIPKSHMIFHCVSFARKWGFLSPFGENPIESHHGDIKRAFARHSNNEADMPFKKQMFVAKNIAIRRSCVVREGYNLLKHVNCKRCSKPKTGDYLGDSCRCDKTNGGTPRTD